MDSPCLIQRLYIEEFAFPIPRTAKVQAEWIKKFRINDLESFSQLNDHTLCPGDIIYFRHDISRSEALSRGVVYAGEDQVLHFPAGGARLRTNLLSHFKSSPLEGVYRLLNCKTPQLKHAFRQVPNTPAPDDSPDRKAARRVLTSFYRSLERQDLDQYQHLWSKKATRWHRGRKSTLPEIIQQRRRQLQDLEGAQVRFTIKSLELFKDLAISNIEVSSSLSYANHTLVEEGINEAFVLGRFGKQWLIIYNEIILGD